MALFLLFLAFLVLRLSNVIDWSWWLVTAPLWGAVALVVLALALGSTALASVNLLRRLFHRRR